MVILATWKRYAKKMEDTDDVLYQLYVDAAEKIVTDYLGYEPTFQQYTHSFLGEGKIYLQLKAKPIAILTSVTVDGVAKTISDFTIDEEFITEKNGNPFPAGSTVVVEYTAGNVTITQGILMVCMQIASLLSMQAGENIGVSSVTFDGGNTRSFVNYADFSKQLAAIKSYRIARFKAAGE